MLSILFKDLCDKEGGIAYFSIRIFALSHSSVQEMISQLVATLLRCHRHSFMWFPYPFASVFTSEKDKKDCCQRPITARVIPAASWFLHSEISTHGPVNHSFSFREIYKLITDAEHLQEPLFPLFSTDISQGHSIVLTVLSWQWVIQRVKTMRI